MLLKVEYCENKETRFLRETGFLGSLKSSIFSPYSLFSENTMLKSEYKIIDRLISENNFWISVNLYNRVLQFAGE